MKNQSIFALDLLNEIRDLIIKSRARVMQGTRYVPVVAPLLIPSGYKTISISVQNTNREPKNIYSQKEEKKMVEEIEATYLTSMMAIFGRHLRGRS